MQRFMSYEQKSCSFNTSSFNKNSNEEDMLKQFPKIKFSYESKPYKKVSQHKNNNSVENSNSENKDKKDNKEFYFIIPKGKKYLVWFKNNECYCDGALFSNYPVKQCIDNGANPDEILGIGYNPNNNGNDIITTNSSLFDYIVTVIKKYITSITITPSVSIAYEYFVSGPTISIYDILNTTSDPNIRIELIEQGKQKVVKSLSIGTE